MKTLTFTTEKPTMKSYQFLIATLLFALTSVPDVLAQQKAVPAPAAASAAASAVAAKPVAEEESAAVSNKPAAQGIKVHGHWVLQVKNADGTLGERREFDNSLTTVGGIEASGDQFLGLLLSGNAVVGDPAVAFSNNTAAISDPAAFCFYSNGNIMAGGAGCGILTTAASFFDASAYGGSGSTVQTGLTMLFTTSPVTWVLSGTYTVVAGQTTIGTVQTLIGVCIAPSGPINTSGASGHNQFVGSSTSRTAPTSPSTCDIANDISGGFAARFGTLTSTLVTPSALTVTPGQLVQVTVTISFS